MYITSMGTSKMEITISNTDEMNSVTGDYDIIHVNLLVVIDDSTS